MGKLNVLPGKEVCRILRKHGFQKVRRKGSHVVMQKQIIGSTITVVVPDHKEIRMGTLKSIIRQSGINRANFE
ncbi:MAG: type II toxin-antitoxin system HicA family toxin [Deltaproteobacteria bacterium]|uniref:type II toxin-antitoxin system HicA family toxin n=1 Tax=Desulfosarcina sp. BuS5 TaxID=933262 RepID=UPI000489F787|nr:type II toxin-antitoxin system HicA family toxin [Desulfosarcina sp. BuS5]MCD6274024.1 type II toxin-antitoxin system HicA family toxin [Deltaproteobacteria bacterium]